MKKARQRQLDKEVQSDYSWDLADEINDSKIAPSDSEAPTESRGRGSRSADEVFWSYRGEHGPQSWGSSFPKCSQGKKQSPIDIQTRDPYMKAEDIFNIAELKWQFPANENTKSERGEQEGRKYERPQPLFIHLPVNSRFQNLKPRRKLLAMELFNGHAFEVERLGEEKLYIEGAAYDLREFITHTPSEHWVDGKGFDLEIQLVHVLDMSDYQQPRSSSNSLYVIVSLLFSAAAEGDCPPFLFKLADALPKTSEQPRKLIDSLSFKEIASELGPYLRSYFRYEGSLTTPPCTEGVVWFIASKPIPLSKDVLQALSKLEGRNNRPIQPLNGRVVRYVP
mmetsp:Transcript_40283/g.126830  ORF Transcript_40283/g.126830 Transcript_40283/m.126830 type:complete len:337 (-) Transcript_40283:80-1090(-)